MNLYREGCMWSIQQQLGALEPCLYALKDTRKPRRPVLRRPVAESSTCILTTIHPEGLVIDHLGSGFLGLHVFNKTMG
jgi:hypothetical protein